MILKRLTLERYGIYRERVSFDLSPRVRYQRYCPIILFGGKNGAGKTTILTALRLALHGALALPRGPERTTYGEFLRARINRESGASAISPTSVELEFEYALSGHRYAYIVQRSWYDDGGSIKENVEVRRNGSLLKEVDREHWSEFVRDLVPPGLLELFFFDGEKIQNLAEDDSDGTHFKEALASLLNLDLIDTLRADLAVYARRERAEQGTPDLLRELENLRKGKVEASEAVDTLRARLGQNQTRLDQLTSKRQQLERSLTSRGGNWGANRPALKSKKDELGATLKGLEDRVRELCHGALPLALLPPLARRLQSHVQGEREESVRQRVLAQAAEWLGSMDDPAKLRGLGGDRLTLPREGRAAWTSFLTKLSKTLATAPAAEGSVPLIHGLSAGQEMELSASVDLALGSMVREVADLARGMESTLRELKEVEITLGKVPAEDALAQLLEELRVVTEELGARAQETRHLDEELRSAERAAADLDRRANALIEQVEADEGLLSRLSLTSKVSKALEAFRKILARNRIRHLERLATESFQRLARKKCLVHEVKISPETFDVSLHNHSGQLVSKKDLSAGEKQIYAVSILWALGKVSGRPLPIVIDTPLGRLDSDHRKQLVCDYFPFASHQVIILSTDTEVDHESAEILKPYVARTYRLDFSTAEQSSRVESGYFWDAVSVQE